jgi:L-asparaginase/Glu-tRNA(Gln) amidotransferase subunit D
MQLMNRKKLAIVLTGCTIAMKSSKRKAGSYLV